MHDKLSKNYDLIIIGDGIVSRFIQSRLHSKNIKILVIDAGNKKKGKRNKSLFNIKNKNHPNHHDINLYHLSGKGGTSLSWGGRLANYSTFEHQNVKRDYWNEVIGSKGFYREALDFFGISNTSMGIKWRINEDHYFSYRMQQEFFSPIRFHKKQQFQEIDYLYNSTVKRFKNTQDGSYVILKNGFSFKYKKLIIACNAIQSTKLIHNSLEFDDIEYPYGFHLKFILGKLKVNQEIINFFEYFKNENGKWAANKIEFNLNKKNINYNGVFRLVPLNFFDNEHNDGVLSVLHLLKFVLTKEYRNYITDQNNFNFFQHVKIILRSPFSTLLSLIKFTKKRVFESEPIPSYIDLRKSKYVSLEINMPYLNHEASFFKFSEQDSLNFNPKFHKTREALKDITDEIKEIIKSEFNTELIISKNEIDKIFDQNLVQGGHVCSLTPYDDRIVNKYFQVNPYKNVFTISSAILKTPHHANPTLTIVALANKLLEDIESEW